MRGNKLETEFLKSIYGKTEEQLTEQEKETKEIICKQYADRFQTELENGTIPHADGEQFKQCLDPLVPYWFISSDGNVWSVVDRNARKLKPIKGDSSGKKWKKLKTPYGNIPVHKLVACQWCENQFADLFPNDSEEIHHIEPNAENPNKAELLEPLPTTVHKHVTQAQMNPTVTLEEAEAEKQKVMDEAREQGVPIFNSHKEMYELMGNQRWSGDGIMYVPYGDGACIAKRIKLVIDKQGIHIIVRE